MNQTIKLAREATYFLPLMLLAVVFGFWPSYFAALGSIRVSLHVHGLLMFAWMVGLVGQGILIQTGQRKWHRRVGRMSFAVAPAMVVTGLFVTREFIGRAGSNPDRFALEVFTISVLSIFAFGLLFGLAIAYRRQPQLHARFMVGTGLTLIGAGLLRIFLNWVPGFSSFTSASQAGLVVVEVATIALIVNDSRVGGMRSVVQSPFVVVLILTVFLHAMLWLAPGWVWWRSVAEWMGRAT